MSDLLKIGQVVNTESSKTPYTVGTFLGGGGQGEVYVASSGGKSVALKWYYPESIRADPSQRSRLIQSIESGTPSNRFLWPIAIVSNPEVQGFGYIMPLREPQYKSLVDLVTGRIQPTFRSLAMAGFQLADSFKQLHSKGFSYSDISFGNIFFNPDTGDILICDNDNVAVNGVEEGGSGVLGTPRFMAPELVTGKIQRPNTDTDLYSLSVLLFYMLMIHHPLDGKNENNYPCLDADAMYKLYGAEALFIFDPEDDSNAPDPQYHGNALFFWEKVYPEFLRNLFVKAFTNGIRDPKHGRVRESEWRNIMIRLQDSILYCVCGEQNFYDADFLKTNKGKLKGCWNCQQELRVPPRIRIDKNIIMLNHDTKLFPHHLDRDKTFDFSQPVAEVTRHPTNPNIWGLKNLGSNKWVYTNPNGDIKDVISGKSMQISVGTKISFGTTEGEIRI